MRRGGSRLTGLWIPGRLDGSGLVRLQISDYGFNEFKMASFPQPRELQTTEGQGLAIKATRYGYNLGGARFRIATPERAPSGKGKWRTVRFQLGTNYTNEALLVLAKQLRDVDAPFTGLCNENGSFFSHIGTTSMN